MGFSIYLRNQRIDESEKMKTDGAPWFPHQLDRQKEIELPLLNSQTDLHGGF